MFSDLILIQLRNLHAYIQPAINYYSNISSFVFMLLNFRGTNYAYKFSNTLRQVSGIQQLFSQSSSPLQKVII